MKCVDVAVCYSKDTERNLRESTFINELQKIVRNTIKKCTINKKEKYLKEIINKPKILSKSYFYSRENLGGKLPAILYIILPIQVKSSSSLSSIYLSVFVS